MESHLVQLGLTSFKSFRDATIPLGPFTLLVGTNASGKSNIRDALRFLHGCAQGFTFAEVIGEKWGPGGVLVWRGIRGGTREISFRESGEFSMRASLRVPSSRLGSFFRYNYSIEIALEPKRGIPRVVRESLYSGPLMRFDSHPQADPVAQEDSAHLRVRFPRGGSHRKHGPVHRYLSSTTALAQIIEDESLSKSLQVSSRNLTRSLQGIRFLDLSPDAMREPSAPGHLVLGDRGENLSSVLLHILNESQRKESLIGWLRALTPLDVIDLEFESDLLGRVLVYLVETDGSRISAQSASDGTLRFLALAAALLSPESGQIYFFEEIDNGFHPTRLHLLLDILEQASRKLGCQIIATTHNPQLLALLSSEALGDAVLIYRLERESDSRAVRVLDLPDIQRILENQDLSRLFATGWLEDTVEFLNREEAPRANRRHVKENR